MNLWLARSAMSSYPPPLPPVGGWCLPVPQPRR